MASRDRSGLVGLCVGVVVGAGLVAMAGDVDPPSGAVSGTMKTLEDVEPRVAIRNGAAPIVINQRGSYYLAEDVFAMAGEHGIEITASHVTLDLNGFAVIGTTELGSLDGIRIDPSVDNAAVLNGVVRDCPESGIYANGTRMCRFEDVRVKDCADFGILGGDEASIIRCRARDCGAVGFQTTDGGMISQCHATECGTGIFSNAGLVHGCCAVANNTNFLTPGATAHDNN